MMLHVRERSCMHVHVKYSPPSPPFPSVTVHACAVVMLLSADGGTHIPCCLALAKQNLALMNGVVHSSSRAVPMSEQMAMPSSTPAGSRGHAEWARRCPSGGGDKTPAHGARNIATLSS